MGKLFSRPKSKHVTYGRNSSPQMEYRKASDSCSQFTDLKEINNVRQFDPVHVEPVTCVVYVESSVCLSGSKDQSLVLFDYDSGKTKQRWLGHEKEVTKVAYGSEIRSYFSGSRDKNINMWKTDSPDPVLQFKGHDLVISGLALNSANTQMCTGSRDNSLRLWDVNTGECLHQNSVTRNLVTHVAWAANSDIIAQTGEDKEVKIWDARSLSVVQRFSRKQHIQNWCDISPDTLYCLTCSNGFQGNGCEATLWDLRTSKIVHEFKGHMEGIGSCTFLPAPPGTEGKHLLATCSSDCSVKIWDQHSSVCLASINIPGSGPLTSITVCDNNRFCVSSFNTGIHVLQMSLSAGGEVSLDEIIQY